MKYSDYTPEERALNALLVYALRDEEISPDLSHFDSFEVPKALDMVIGANLVNSITGINLRSSEIKFKEDRAGDALIVAALRDENIPANVSDIESSVNRLSALDELIDKDIISKITGIEVSDSMDASSLLAKDASTSKRVNTESDSFQFPSADEIPINNCGALCSTSSLQTLNKLGETKMAKATKKNKNKRKRKENRELNEAAQFHKVWEEAGSADSLGSPTTGAGLIDNGGVFDVGAGPGILVNADDVEFDSASAAGNGLLGSNGVVDVGEGDGITVLADRIEAKVDTAKALTVDSANGIQVVADSASGIRVDSTDGLQAKISDGLEFDHSGIAVSAGDGIDTSCGDVRAKVDVNSGLQLDATDGIQVNSGYGLEFSAGALTVNCMEIAGNGLVESGGTLRVGGGDGIRVIEDNVEVEVDSAKALHVDSACGIQVVADTSNGIQIDSTAGLQAKLGNALQFDGSGNIAVTSAEPVSSLASSATLADVIEKVNDMLQTLRSAGLLAH